MTPQDWVVVAIVLGALALSLWLVIVIGTALIMR